MIRQVIKYIIAASVAIFSIQANAAQVILKLANEITSHHDKLDINAEIYYSTGPGPLDIGKQKFKVALPSEKVYEWLNLFNRVIADKHLVTNFDGKQSQITLGYQKDGSDIYPVSCKNIEIKSTTNVLMSERGCSVY